MDHGELLKILLHELTDGVIVCSSDAKIILFNHTAEVMFGRSPSLAKGRSLYDLCHRPPVEEALNLLDFLHDNNKQDMPYVQFMNKIVDREQFLRCRISFLAPQAGTKNSFVLLLEDISAWYTAEGSILSKIEDFRAPMTNLRAAVENLTDFPEMSPVMRSGFENVLVQETFNLAAAYKSLADSCNVFRQSQSHLAELNMGVFINYITHYLSNKNIPVQAGQAQTGRVKIDIYSLFLVLDFLLTALRKRQTKKGFRCEINSGEHFLFIDFIMPGKRKAVISTKTILEKNLQHSLGSKTVASILHTMEADMWNQQHDRTGSMLRLALPLVKNSTI